MFTKKRCVHIFVEIKNVYLYMPTCVISVMLTWYWVFTALMVLGRGTSDQCALQEGVWEENLPYSSGNRKSLCWFEITSFSYFQRFLVTDYAVRFPKLSGRITIQMHYSRMHHCSYGLDVLHWFWLFSSGCHIQFSTKLVCTNNAHKNNIFFTWQHLHSQFSRNQTYI